MAAKLLPFAFAFCIAVNAERVSYDGYKVIRLTPATEEQAKLVRTLEDRGYHFWSGPAPANRSSDIMIPPCLDGEDLLTPLRESGMKVEEYIQNIEKLIEEEKHGIQDTTLTRAQFSFAQYHTLADAYNFLDEIAANHSSIASIVSIGKSFEGRDLKLLKISKSGETRPAVWLDSNIHAREWITSAVCLYVINQLLTSTDPEIQKWTDDYDWYILPHHNPDGFEYSRNTNRIWRKTRSTTSIRMCKGVDPNRNWGFHWAEDGASANPCIETYAGPFAFSEKETKAASDFLIGLGDRLTFVLSLHSYSQLLLIPYGVDLPFDRHAEYMRIAQLTVDAMSKRYGTQFTPGNIVDLLYVASGSSGDWAQGVRNVRLAFTFELRDTGSHGFILPANQIIPSAEELIDGMKVILGQLNVMLENKASN